MLLNVDSNAKIVIESELYICANARLLVLMNVSSLYWSPFHANECVFSCNEQQKVYKTMLLFLFRVYQESGAKIMEIKVAEVNV